MKKIKHSHLKGLSFGLTSGIITTLGMMIGLNSGTHSKLAVLGGILTVAIADAFSDAFGIHISEEASGKVSKVEVWESTIATFAAKLFFASTFLIPVLVFESLMTAVWVSIAWGFLMLSLLSYFTATGRGANPWKIMREHWVIAAVVVTATHFTGQLIHMIFGGL